jgi:hypothetical protein
MIFVKHKAIDFVFSNSNHITIYEDIRNASSYILINYSVEKKYDIFFLAPGICSLVKQGKLDLKKIKILIDQYQSQAKFINIEDVSLALPILSSALNIVPQSFPYYMVPPSTGNILPTANVACCEHKKATTEEISFVCPRRPIAR